tara:strand:- start:659 stop:802 length:144 start_codon:yes stop_codon:yes gene_type:complete
MKYFLFVILFFLYSCESVNSSKDVKKNIKNKAIQMKATTEPSIKIKK